MCELCYCVDCVVVVQLLSYGGFLNLSLVDGDSDYVHCDLLLEVSRRESGGGATSLVTVLSLNP